MSDEESDFLGFDDEENEEDDDTENESPLPEILKTSKNKDMLSYQGFLFYENRKPVDGTHYWECRGRPHSTGGNKRCPARLITDRHSTGYRVLSSTSHNHELDPVYALSVKYRTAIKRKATEDGGAPAKILKATASNFPNAVQQRLSINAQRKILRRARRDSVVSSKDPESLNDFAVDDRLQRSIDGDKFLLADISDNDQRALVFGTHENLRRLSTAKYWVADGTFDSVPGLFRQLFTIQGSIGPNHDVAFPLVMTSKAETLYRSVLEKLTEVADETGIELNPSVILTDYEKGLINAFEAEFPDSRHNGCYFHLSKNWWKYIQQHKLLDVFHKNEHYYEFFKKAQALAFLPPERIGDAFNSLKATAPQELTNFFTYVEEIYVFGRIRRTAKSGRISRLEPLYPPKLWSIYSNVLDHISRTTNQIEAWHGRWNRLVERNAGIVGIIKELRLEEKTMTGQIMAHLAGLSVRKRRTADECADEILFNIVSNFENYDLDDYVAAIAANLGSKAK